MKNDMKFYTVIVLYNKKIDKSQAIQSLIKLKRQDIDIIVLDNSNEKFISYNQKWGQENINAYYCMGGNIGLSKAYNYALKLLRNLDGNDIIVWLDDDTPIPDKYFDVLEKKAKNINFDVFAPIVYGQNGIIYSPNEIGVFKGKYIKSEEQYIPDNKFNAINSCLAVRIRAYKDYSYDESLFMDCVDTKLFDDFRAMKLKFCVLPISIYQNFFQRSEDKDENKYWARFRIRIRDTVVYSRGSIQKRFIGIIRIMGWAVVYGIKLKSFSFFGKCILLGVKLNCTTNRIGGSDREN